MTDPRTIRVDPNRCAPEEWTCLMRAYTLTHLGDAALLRALAKLVAQDRATTAALLAHIAEVDARRLYAPAGYSSMHAYCVGELRLSEDAAFKRIQGARAGREFPILFAALADGRLHLTGLCLLVPHLTAANVDELLAAATHRRKSEIEVLLAQRVALPGAAALPPSQLAPAQPGASPPACGTAFGSQPASAQVEDSRQTLGASGGTFEAPPETASDSAVHYALHVTIDRSTHDKLRYAQALLSHALPSGDVAMVLDRALDALIGQLERRRFAAAARPREPRQASTRSPRQASTRNPRQASTRKRHVPAHVRRAVWQRDQGQCTFVGATGHRCRARKFLEFDHVEPVARGGRATIEGMRLRCRTHNQMEAERAFGAEFVQAKREQARRAVVAKAEARRPPGVMVRPPSARIRPPGAAVRPPGATIRPLSATIRPLTATGPPRIPASDPSQALRLQHRRDVASALRELGVRSGVARHAMEAADRLPDATLEERVRAALLCLAPRPARAAPASRAMV